jgi:DNA-binding NarL/FixJ family response regulator
LADRPIRVLLVDDEEDIRLLLRRYLSSDDRFEVVAEATNGEEALARCGEIAVDVVVLDLHMPVLDGIATLPRLRAECPEVEVAVFTAFGDDARRWEAERLGAAAFISKGEPLPYIAARLASIAP